MKIPRICLMTALFAMSASAQLQLFRVTGNVEVAVSPLCDLGAIYSGETTSALFRLRNPSAAPAPLAVLDVAGAGFSLSGPALPATVPPAGAVDFTVTFHASTIGSYSATLTATGTSVLLIATVAPSLTYTVALPSGLRQLGMAPIDFGQAPVGSTATLHFIATNQTTIPLLVPAIAVSGAGFSLPATPPSGTILQPQEQTAFDVQFAPQSPGTASGTLAIGDRTYSLAGTSPAPPLPKPILSIDPAQLASGQQGSVAVQFDAAAASQGTGTLALSFQPAVAGPADSAIAFAAGAGPLPFTFSPGDTQAHFGDSLSALFQTGTTAGTLTFTASIGGTTVQQSLILPAAPITITNATVVRTAGGLSIAITGWDNTRTAGSAIFTFYDATGAAVPPGPITADLTKDFAAYFPSSELGGMFVLTSLFPITGDASQVRSVDIQLANAVAATKYPRIAF